MSLPELASDCARCAGLCCVLTSFEKSEDFARDKPAGVPCPELRPDHRCAIHDSLHARGYSGCTVYECYGAGPRVTRAFVAVPAAEPRRHRVFLMLRELHEALWLLLEARKLCPASHPEVSAQLTREIALHALLLDAPLGSLREPDVHARVQSARDALRRVGDALGGGRARRRLAQAPRERH